ncbi:MAG: hypothetical protein AUK44_09555 [Porphyromonadaceae bacterium CG2_30_38_12]|nr:MAG: hypothetical protein AUK44_09555 [Porphyromonadaceae bacterium CG2_30_38_12]
MLSVFTLTLTSCFDDKYKDINANLNLANFDFKTTKSLTVSVSTLNNANQPMGNVYMELYTQNPLKDDGTLISNSSDYLVYKGMTDANGLLSCQIALASSVDSLSVLVNQIGLPSPQQYKLTSNEMNIIIGGNSAQSAPKKVIASTAAAALPDPLKVNGFYVLGSWDKMGLPAYLTTNDLVENDFLADVNASLPESVKLTASHPEYLTTGLQSGLVLIDSAEVWVTFVHEGAGYLNALGFYTYPTAKVPTTVSEITDPTIIFPNVSYTGKGGSLTSGNKVQLLYLNPKTNKYTTIFPKGITIAWFLKANGFKSGTVKTTSTTFYSDSKLNPEATPEKRIHNVLLKDNARKLLVLGFEDLNRDGSSDEDFNDAVFYATASPYTAVLTDVYQKIDTPLDSDGDGVSDTRDEYPADKDRAFNNYYPSKNNVGTLAFEDLWPNKGDYDFNDLVIDYNFNQITNAANQIVAVDAELTVKAIGASLRNPFAIEFNTTADNVKTVSGQNLNKAIFKLNANKTEANQNKAVVPVFEDPYAVLGFTGSIVNTVIGGAYSAPKTISLQVEFNTPIALTAFGTAPYNPFIIINGERGKEVHLPGSTPTALADISFFGTGDDNSDVASGKYYMSDKYLPWAINIPVEFSYPAEKQDITKTFLVFNNWASSRGYNYMDWYLDKNGYRDVTKIFKK